MIQIIVNSFRCDFRCQIEQIDIKDLSNHSEFRSSPPDVLLQKNVLKICRKFTGEHPCWSAISIKLGLTLLKSHFAMGVLY